MEYNECHHEDLPIEDCVDEGSALLPNQSSASPVQNMLDHISTMEPKKKPQIFTALAACLGAMAFGSVIGFSSPAGPLFINGNSGINLTTRQNDWISSSVTIGALVGCPVGGVLMKTIGRKMTMMGSGIPYMAGWALIVGGQNFAMLLIGRLICGFCVGVTTVTVPTYISEIASTNIRGTLSSLFQLMVTIGILYGYAMGPAFDSFREIALVCSIVPLLYTVAVYFCRESPLFLLMKNKDAEAVSALQVLRGSKCDVRKETQIMKDSIEEAKRAKVTLIELSQPYVLKPLIIAVFLMIFQQFSGINAVIFNLSLIFQESGSSLSHDVSAIIIAVVQVAFTVVSTFLIDRLGRKILLLISSFLMCVSLVGLGLFFYLKDQANGAEEAQDLIDELGWLPMTSLISFIAAFSIGFGPVPWIMMGEMFFPNVKELAASLATTSNWLCAFITTVTFGMLTDAIGSHGVYWLFAGCCAINFIFCCILVPETKGKTVEEITELFGRTAYSFRRIEDTQN